jgi:hypothetical protein
MATVDPGYLIPFVRLYLGDVDPTAYRYTQPWLDVAIEASINSSWFSNKYTMDSSGLVSRNPNEWFSQNEPPVIMAEDERPIVLLAAAIVLQGSLENSAWNLASWKDNEISYSNLEMGRSRNASLQRIWDELLYLMLPPTKRLAGTQKASLPGFLNNDYEREGKL